ncbi:hypothetical protein PGTUg99_001185 [Puccinia graminis f. sp. tritici]|uniref:Uncharacterized protein n=1 Tax=Puccinia graminis f. sp. tritici TaxID=56615 RepID=A0A5B0SG56_PUCGR|nr:hypothetical protein PGTUg99_001185 [Puccinia graminis f. sp. tritici]
MFLNFNPLAKPAMWSFVYVIPLARSSPMLPDSADSRVFGTGIDTIQRVFENDHYKLLPSGGLISREHPLADKPFSHQSDFSGIEAHRMKLNGHISYQEALNSESTLAQNRRKRKKADQNYDSVTSSRAYLHPKDLATGATQNEMYVSPGPEAIKPIKLFGVFLSHVKKQYHDIDESDCLNNMNDSAKQKNHYGAQHQEEPSLEEIQNGEPKSRRNESSSPGDMLECKEKDHLLDEFFDDDFLSGFTQMFQRKTLEISRATNRKSTSEHSSIRGLPVKIMHHEVAYFHKYFSLN